MADALGDGWDLGIYIIKCRYVPSSHEHRTLSHYAALIIVDCLSVDINKSMNLEVHKCEFHALSSQSKCELIISTGEALHGLTNK